MALILIKEDGTGRADANSYASAADGDAYHEGHVDAGTWTGASTAQKEAALVMATRLIDVCYQFNGWKKAQGQGLQWPRTLAPDPDNAGALVTIFGRMLGAFYDSDTVPAAVVSAACEQARALLAEDRTADPAGEGMKQLTIVGALSVTFDRQDRMPMLTGLVRRMLAKLGTLLGPEQGMAKLVRT